MSVRDACENMITYGDKRLIAERWRASGRVEGVPAGHRSALTRSQRDIDDESDRPGLRRRAKVEAASEHKFVGRFLFLKWLQGRRRFMPRQRYLVKKGYCSVRTESKFNKKKYI